MRFVQVGHLVYHHILGDAGWQQGGLLAKVHRNALEQQLSGDLIGFHQTWRGNAGQRGYGLRDALVVIQPWLAIAQVQRAQLGAQRDFLQYVFETGATGARWGVNVALDVAPAQAG